MQRRTATSERFVTVCEFRAVNCRFNGIQFGGKKPLELWTPVDLLREGASGDLAAAQFYGSTISAQTLRRNRLIPVACIA